MILIICELLKRQVRTMQMVQRAERNRMKRIFKILEIDELLRFKAFSSAITAHGMNMMRANS